MILELLIIRTKDKTKTMNIIKTNIEGVLIIEPRLFRDARGYFFESFSEREFEEKVSPILGHSVHFCQDKRVYEQLWCNARSALPAPTLHTKQAGPLRKRQSPRCSGGYS